MFRKFFENGDSNMTKSTDSIVAQLVKTTQSDKIQALGTSINDLSVSDKQIVEQVLSGVLSPSPKTSDAVWLIIIWAFSGVMVGAVVVLSVGMFMPPVTGGTKSDTILTVFTTVTAFLAGLFAPSPVAKSTE
jgi:hypothetical protein